MKFIFECSNQIGFEHEKINFISPSNHVLFYLLYKPTNYDVFTIFRRFPKISENFQNVVRRLYECFRTFSENFRSFLTIAEEDPKMFRLNIDLLWLVEHWNMLNSAS